MEKERKCIYIVPFIYYVYLKAFRHGSQFYLQILHACFSFASVHKMVPPQTEVGDIIITAYYSSMDHGWMKD